jgi:hypothetical protein
LVCLVGRVFWSALTTWLHGCFRIRRSCVRIPQSRLLDVLFPLERRFSHSFVLVFNFYRCVPTAVAFFLGKNCLFFLETRSCVRLILVITSSISSQNRQYYRIFQQEFFF